MIYGEQIEFQKASPCTGALRSSIWVNGRVRINYKLNPCSTLLPCTALHFRAQHRLFLKVHAETKYCLSSRQQDTLTTVQKTNLCMQQCTAKKGQMHKYKAVQREHELQCATKINSQRNRADYTDNPEGHSDERSCEMVTTGPCVGVAVRMRRTKGRVIQGFKKKKRKHSRHVSGGAGIPPEPQLTQTQKGTRQHGKQAERRFSAGITSLVSSSSILLKCRPLACSQEEKLNSIFSAQNHIPDTCQCPLNRCSTQTVSLLNILFPEDWKMVLTSQFSLFELACVV